MNTRKIHHRYGFDFSILELAKMVGVSYGHCRRILSENRCQNPIIAMEIDRATGGAVSAEQLLGLKPGQGRA